MEEKSFRSALCCAHHRRPRHHRHRVAEQPGRTLSAVYVYFETRIHALAAAHNKSVQTWHNAFAAVKKAGKSLPKDAIAHVWMGTAAVNNQTIGMGSLVQVCPPSSR